MDEKANKIAFFSTISPGDTARIDTMLGYALAGIAMGYEVVIFLALDSALVAKKVIFEKLDTKIKDRIENSINEGIKIGVCSASAKTFGIEVSDLIKGTEIEGIATFFSYAQDAKIVLSWS